MKKIVVSLGGSLVVPEKGFINLNYLKRFKRLILKFLKRFRFFIVVGGGKLARFYQSEARKIKVSDNDLDWLGIFSSRLNAQFVKSLFGKIAHPEIIVNPEEKRKIKERLVFAAGSKPGWSTDYVSVSLAKTFTVNEILNLTNIDYIYNKDPRKFKDAKPLKEISWDEYFKIIGKKWIPGGNYPFDPVGANLAKKLKIKVVSIDGKNLRAVENYLTGKKFIGTIIRP
jgi:uridylate kinase